MSVVIPAWNAAGTLRRALDSALSGGVEAVECVVVDDGSTDATAAVARGIAAADPRVVVVEAPANGGASAARNLGLAAARGHWLTFLDSDDVLLPGGLEAMVRATDQDDALAVVGQRVWTDGKARWITAAYDHPDIRTPGRTSLVQRPGLLFYASATGKLFHRSIVDGLAFEGRVLGDQPWTIRALLRAGDGVVVIGDVVYEWRRDAAAGPSSITAAKHGSARLAAEAARVAVRALSEVAAEAEAQLPDPAQRRRVVTAYFERLVRSDLAGPVRRAVATRDPGTSELFAAIETFLVGAPPEIVGSSAALARDVLRPPLDRWVWLSEAAKAACVRLLRAVAASHPGVLSSWPSPGPLALSIRLLLRAEAPSPAASAGRAAATALLAARLPIVLLQRLRRRRSYRRTVTSGER